VSQTVKEVVQSLVDDNLVKTDKIGSSNFFWSFPSQHGTEVQNRLRAVKDLEAAQQEEFAELKAQTEVEKASRPQSEDRAASLSQLDAAKERLAALEEELARYGACDPIKVEEKRRAVTLAKEAAIRWTDNYCILLSHMTRQGVDPEEIRKFLEIDEEYEDIN
ncbi:meiotic nuclear division protein 1, partial [Punctularia strigosozonata HHB-11173 SS5]|uniref:meiotic nuclear division protein 1 n=1 Tax=Punctularia strigosozonata (strain HHB-11173) TaxID=741275 RepID=UPI0004416281